MAFTSENNPGYKSREKVHRKNRENITALLKEFPGVTNDLIGEYLHLSETAVANHTREIKRENYRRLKQIISDRIV